MQYKNRIIVLSLLPFLSCSPYKAVYKTRTDMGVILVNDSILYFSQRGGAGDYHYTKEGNEIKVPAREKDLRTPFEMDMNYGEVFQVYKDSIVMLRNNLVFYDKHYYERHNIGETFYFIQNGVKHKVTPGNPRGKQYFKVLLEKYFHKIIPPEQALREYGVNPNYDCWMIYDEEQHYIQPD